VKLIGKEAVNKKLSEFYTRQLKKYESDKELAHSRTTSFVEQCKEIISHLNAEIGSKYNYKSKATQKLIKARLDEGFSVEDFKKVHEVKSFDWLDNPEMRLFLRPATLYRGSKFEGYLQENNIRKVKSKAKREKEAEIRKQKAEEGKIIRTEVVQKKWYEFKTYQQLWSHVAKMNEKEITSYDLPEELRNLQAKYLRLKFTKQTDQAERIFRQTVERNMKLTIAKDKTIRKVDVEEK